MTEKQGGGRLPDANCRSFVSRALFENESVDTLALRFGAAGKRCDAQQGAANNAKSSLVDGRAKFEAATLCVAYRS